MSVRSSVVRLIVRAGMVVGAILAVTILLAAMPGHNTPKIQMTGQMSSSGLQQQRSSSQQTSQQAAQQSSQEMAGMDHSQMSADASAEKANEKAAVSDMSHMSGGAHMHMTEMREQTPQDVQRANQIAAQLRGSIEKYRDYHVALNEGYRIFLPDFPQPEYHFTNYKNGFMAAMRFDPTQPTSLLYRKTADGYELVGAMYTMPKRATEEQLNERVPLSVAMWHLHTNLCMPAKDQRTTADWTKFGLQGSIATQDGCDVAGGSFHASVFGWMVHVYPY